MDNFEKQIATIIGNNISEARTKILIQKKNGKYRKMTQKEIADLSKVERSTYAKIEKGLYIPRISTLIRISKVLHTDIHNILNGI